MSANSELFPAIGSVADQTEKLPVETQTVEVTLDEEKPVQEIESLCMRCEEQVRKLPLDLPANRLTPHTGSYKASFDFYPIFPGGHRYVFSM